MSMKQGQGCYVCKALSKSLAEARAKNNSSAARIAYDQMRDHLMRVKYIRKHGFIKELKA